jgi:primase-polymerase (primpol)-like protein
VGEILDRDAARYVGWCWRRQGQYWTKPPFHVTGSGTIALASTTDARTWMKLEAAYLAWYQRKVDGLGIVLLDEPVGLRRIDLDGCRDPQRPVRG